MKIPNWFLGIVALGVLWLAFGNRASQAGKSGDEVAAATPAPPAKRQPLNPSGPRVTLVGTVEEVMPGGLIVTCQPPARPVASRMARLGGGGGVFGPMGNQSDVFGTLLLRNHPRQGRVADGDRVDVQAIEDGVYRSQGETLHAYWCVGDATEPSAATPGKWRSPLEEKARPTN